jgi:hypothetical protein
MAAWGHDLGYCNIFTVTVLITVTLPSSTRFRKVDVFTMIPGPYVKAARAVSPIVENALNL